MINKELSKEAIELIISNGYIGATNFQWDNNRLSFNYEKENEKVIHEDMFKDLAVRFKENIAYLTGKLEHANETIEMLLGGQHA